MTDGKRKPHTKRTRNLYDKLLEAFRERPGNANYAGVQAGVTKGMARNAWKHGWKGISWARPIEARVQAEGDAAEREAAKMRDQREQQRAQARAVEDADRERARADRVRAVAEEWQIQAGMRGSVRQAAATVLALTPATSQLVRRIMRAVYDESLGIDGKFAYAVKSAADLDKSIEPIPAMKLLKEWGTLMGKVAIAGDAVIRLGVELRGPETVAGGPSMSGDEAREELEHITSIWAGIKEREAIEAAEAAAAAAKNSGGPTSGETIQ